MSAIPSRVTLIRATEALVMFGFRIKKSVPMGGIIHTTIPEMTFFSEASRDGPRGVILHPLEQLVPSQSFWRVLPVIGKLIQYRVEQRK
jgi:hypothetical protein